MTFDGVFALLLTPFDERGDIDWNTYASYVDWQLSKGPNGLFAVCGTSEMKWLTLPERIRLASEAVARAGSVPVVATANLEGDLRANADEIQRVIDTGVAGIVLVPPSGLGKEPDRLEGYFAELADRASCPVFIYEWPLVDDYLIPPDMYGRLVRDHGIAGIKDTTCTVTGITQKLQAAPEAVVFQANTPFLPEAIAAGVRGIMAVTSAAVPDLVIRYWELASNNTQDEEAADAHRNLVFLDAIQRIAHPSTAKHLLRMRGFDFPTACRWPVTTTEEVRQALRVWYRTCGLDD